MLEKIQVEFQVIQRIKFFFLISYVTFTQVLKTSIYKSKLYRQNPTETIKQCFILFITNVMQNITLAPDAYHHGL